MSDDLEFSFFYKITLLELVWWGSGMKSIFQLKAHSDIKERSLLRTLALLFSSLMIGNREVSSAKNLALDFNLFGRSFM